MCAAYWPRQLQRQPFVSLKNYLFTSESVSEGHPDKVCDRISDEIVDAYLAAYDQSRTAIETLATTNRVVIAGESRGPDEIDSEVMPMATRMRVLVIRASCSAMPAGKHRI